MGILNHRKMGLKSLVEDLEMATGGNKEEIKKILIEHKVVHGFSAYRYMQNMKIILSEKEKEVSNEIKSLKEKRVLLEGKEDSF